MLMILRLGGAVFMCALASHAVLAANLQESKLPKTSLSLLNQQGTIPLQGALEYAVDPQDYSLKQILAGADLDWRLGDVEKTNYGQSFYPHWYRLRVADLDQVSGKFFLRHNYGNLDKAIVYYVVNGEVIQQYQAGDTLPFNVRPVDERIPLFPLHHLSHSAIDIYIKARSEGPIEIPLDIVTQEEFDHEERLISLWLGGYFGIMMVMVLYNLLVFFVVKDRAYLFYIAYVIVTAMLQVTLRCYGFKYLWPESETLNNQLILVFTTLLPFFAALFVREFLRLPITGSRIDNIIITFGISVFGSLFVAGFFVPYLWVLKISHVFGFLTVLFGLYLGIKYWLRGVKSARIFSTAWSVYLIFVCFYLLEITGLLQTNPLTKYALEMGSVIEVTLLSLAFGDRINEEKENVSKLLKATKELSLSHDKVTASRIALKHIEMLCRNIEIKDAELFIIQKNAIHMSQYKLYEDGMECKEINASEVEGGLSDTLAQIGSIEIQEHHLLMVIGDENKKVGYLKLGRYHGGKAELRVDEPLIQSVIHSLAQTMEMIEFGEKERLSMIGSMAAAIVHDLKNPIGAIQGCAELARIGSRTDQERDKYLTTIVSETQRMKAMAQEVLEYSRGDIVLNYRSVLANEFIQNLSETLRPMLNTVGIKYEASCDAEKEIGLDVDRMHRVILNLVSNAKDAMLQQDTENPTVSFALSCRDDGIKMVVKDNGPGIPESIRGSLFEPFVTQGKAEGTGLGMAIVKRIVNAHQGDISYTSLAGEGTEFTITIPQIAIPETKKANGSLSGVSVLLAEDNPVNQMVVSKYLEQRDVEVTAVFNGKQVLEALVQKSIDVILMDVEMPEMDGVTATRKVKASDKWKDIPIIGLTGHSHEEEMSVCREAGMVSIVQKPVDKTVLEETILSALNAH